jgi:ketosteroid isomerase-like protein
MKLRITPNLFLIILSLCAITLRANPANISGEGRILAQLDDAWSASAGARDLDKLVSFYADDAVAYPPGAAVASNRADIRKVWEGITDKNYAISWEAKHATIAAGGDLGFTSGTFKEAITGADGKVTHSTGKFLCVWKKQKDGSWKAVHDMWNYDK